MKNSNSVTVVAVLIVIMLVVNFNLFGKIVTDDVERQDPEKIAQNLPSELTSHEQAKEQLKAEIARDYKDIPANTSATKRGELVLVDSTHAYDFEASTTLFPIESPECVTDKASDVYIAADRTVLLNDTTISALNALLNDFASQTGIKDIMIVDGHRTYETQKNVLDNKIALHGEEQGKLIATQPGHSEHHTGFALDLGLYRNGTFPQYDGTGEYEWITKNCHKYGFIIRYPEDKTPITNIGYEPWHLRYVGRAHAEYMVQNNLCLEEYIKVLAGYPIDSARLQINTSDGKQYEIYSCDVVGDSSNIKVPKNYPYTLSGDNAGHIIVTVDKSASPLDESAQ